MQHPNVDHAVPDHFQGHSIHGPFHLGGFEDHHIQTLVDENDHRDDKKCVKQRHLGIEQRITDCRSQSDNQEEFHHGHLRNAATADPADHRKGVRIDDTTAEDDFKVEQRRVVAKEHPHKIEGYDVIIHFAFHLSQRVPPPCP